MRLAWQIYLVGVVIAVVVLGSFITVARALGPTVRPTTPPLVTEILSGVERREDLPAAVDRLRTSYNLAISVRDKSGALIAGEASVPKGVRTVTQPIRTGPAAGALVTVAYPPPPTFTARLWITLAFVLVFLVFGTLGVARWLDRPLTAIAGAARAFGSGELSARVKLERKDEFGQVAHAFDEMADRVEQLLRTERELLANVSHELRTPLARIRTALDIATEGDPTTAQAMLGEIDEDLGELQRLVEDVLTTARLDLEARRAGESLPPLRVARATVAELVVQAVNRLTTAHPDTRVEVDLESNLPALEVDGMLVRRVIGNLLENARRYGPAKGPIELRARAETGKVRLEIEDHGMGMTAEDGDRAFTPFFRAEASRTRAKGGLGLGLTLAKRIVEAHGGNIGLTSELGVGTTVFVELPAG
ncbi:MAG: HAMP domain-containing histidine kinase [Myxococcales bacterium]|nr:HAMP domain-containing histidine kinase [Myxococcales bacterium]